MLALPIDHRGYPIPWFAATVDGKRDFRVADSEKRVRAVKQRLCWICGGRLGRHLAFVIGPMCAVNLNTSEPPCHRDCAEFAVQACPFMILPDAQYRLAHLPSDAELQPGHLGGNPGAACIWITDHFHPYRVDNSWLIRLGAAIEVTWWCGGRAASRQDVLDYFERRLPVLAKMAADEGPDAIAYLQRQVDRTMALLPGAP